MKKSKIAGIGFNVPDNIVKNHDIEEMMDTTDEWIQTRSGIKERRWVLPGTANSDLALPACVKAIENAGITPNDIDAIIVGSGEGLRLMASIWLASSGELSIPLIVPSERIAQLAKELSFVSIVSSLGHEPDEVIRALKTFEQQ